MMPTGRVGRTLAASLIAAVACLGWAQSTFWTLQTIAVRDLRDANAEAERLQSVGLAAYTQFTMSGGLQYVRVRAGCFDAREAAEAWAELLRSGIVREAVPVPVEGTLPGHVACVEVDVGFRKPATWELVSSPGELPTFRVEVAGHDAYLRHEGDGWRVYQAVAPAPEPSPLVPAASGLRQATLAGRPVVHTLGGAALCPGTLLANMGAVAIVDRGDAVVACRLTSSWP